MAKKHYHILHKTFKTPRRKQSSSGVLRQRHSKYCKGSEYRADLLKSKTSKQKIDKESSKALGYLQNQNFDYKQESILCSSGNTYEDAGRTKIRLNQKLLFVNTLEQRFRKAKRYVRRSILHFVRAADTIALFLNTCSVQMNN